ncbi:aminodeoxychorismate lyase [Shouchella lonarensis]|uniref:4-amino-4-deoxychorismate lyase n=1 Tax=Shouchella lonarensis TaxID=1464122 RepID=A0A1G6NU90_9BACI|nr:aminodeoxychorismate lyase [Shouchella lonarensis]SDC71379.1 4-amino-4-deoxychorismate lyase [Shouchella lonarensis]
MYVYVNGMVVSEEEAMVSVFDHGLLYGLGLFETFRWSREGVFRLDAHMSRLQKSLQQVGIHASLSIAEMKEVLATLGEANGLSEAYVRWNITAGTSPLGLTAKVYEHPNVIVYMKPMPPVVAHKTARVLSLPRNTPEGQWRLKSHHFMNNVLAKQTLGDDPTIEGIFLTANGDVAEGITSNIFWLYDGDVYTPSLEAGILNGVTRACMIELLRQAGYKVVEGLFPRSSLVTADGWFMTNAIQGVVPITLLEEQQSRACDEVQQIQHLYIEARAREMG